MIAVDTSTWVAFFGDDSGEDVEALDEALHSRQVVLPPVVLTELLSDPQLPKKFGNLLLDVPLLELKDEFWKRSGLTRSKVLSKNLKARIADAFIAQSCIDWNIALLTRDRDFRHFTSLGLKLYLK